MPVKSHMIVHSALMKELARRGHKVTVFSPFPEEFPIQNFTDIEFKLSYSDLLQNSGEYNLQLQFKLYIAQNEMGGACGAYGGGERCAQGSTGET